MEKNKKNKFERSRSGKAGFFIPIFREILARDLFASEVSFFNRGSRFFRGRVHSERLLESCG